MAYPRRIRVLMLGLALLGAGMRRGDEVTQEVLARPGRYRSVAQN